MTRLQNQKRKIHSTMSAEAAAASPIAPASRRKSAGPKRWTAAGALAVAAVAVSFAGAESAAAYTIVGSVNVQTYCQTNFGSSFNATVVSPGNAYSWRCYNGGQTWYGVNMNLACSQQHATPDAIALDNGNPYSWRCVTG